MAESHKPGFLLLIANWIVQFEWLIGLLIMPLLLFPSSIRSLALLAIPIVWTSRKLSRGRFFDRTPLDWAFFLLSTMLLVSLYATYDIAFSLPSIAGLVLGLAIFYGVVHHSRQYVSFLWAVAIFILGGVGIASLGLMGTVWIKKFPLLTSIIYYLPPRLDDLLGSEGRFHPNIVAGALLWVAPLLWVTSALVLQYVRLLQMRAGRMKTIVLLVFVLSATTLVSGVLLLTQSRGAYLAFAFTLVAILLVARRGFLKTRVRQRWYLLTAILVLFTAVALTTHIFSTERLLELVFGAGETNTGALSLNTIWGRFELWSRALYAIQDFPFTGMGMTTFRPVVNVLYPLFSINPDVDFVHPHNHLLAAAVDLGIPGLVAYLGIWIGSAWMLWITWTRTALSIIRGFVLGLGGGMLAYFIYGMTDTVALGTKPGVMWWFLLGLIASLYLQVNESNRAGVILSDEEWLGTIFR